jgi:hypothetical protein
MEFVPITKPAHPLATKEPASTTAIRHFPICSESDRFAIVRQV